METVIVYRHTQQDIDLSRARRESLVVRAQQGEATDYYRVVGRTWDFRIARHQLERVAA